MDKSNELVDQIRSDKLTYLSANGLNNLKNNLNRTKDVEGIIIETGCALGGSAILISKCKNKGKKFYIYDVFGVIPPPSEKDGVDVHQRYKQIIEHKSKGIGNQKYYGYEENLLNKVKLNFKKYGIDTNGDEISFIKGLYQDTLKDLNETVSFAHIDCDWYESVLCCLKYIEPKLSIGGILTIDDYNAWSGCKRAVDEYFKDKKNYKFEKFEKLNIIKLS